jgi:hypothetical protein
MKYYLFSFFLLLTLVSANVNKVKQKGLVLDDMPLSYILI